MSDDAPPPKQQDAGAPAWVMTFADLMSLLMCFFVLLLSFSEMDVAKYKQLAGSMKNAFGVQREIKAKEPPKGINVIAREFSPGRPEPTPFNVIRQMTTSEMNVNLDLGKQRRRPVPTPKAEQIPDKEKSFKPHERASKEADSQEGPKAGLKADRTAGEKSGERAQDMPGRKAGQADGLTEAQKKELAEAKKLAAARLDRKLKEAGAGGMKAATAVIDRSAEEKIRARIDAERLRKLEKSAKLISSALGKEIRNGSVDVETEGRKIIIRVREKASFASGRAELKDSFRPLLAKVARILKDSEGSIIVAGHTDNLPIYTERFRSNWELSSARAVSVAHEMMLASDIPSSRFLVQGFADTRPMAKNDTAANRAKNRRVEIVLQQGDDVEAKGREIRASEAPEAAMVPAAKKVKRSAPAAKPARTVSKQVSKKKVVVPKAAAKNATKRQVVRQSGTGLRVKSSATAGAKAAGKPKPPAKPANILPKAGVSGARSGGIRVGGAKASAPKVAGKPKATRKKEPVPARTSGIRVGGSR